VQGGKDGVLRLLNLDNLSGQSAPGHTGGEVSMIGVPQGGEILTQPATWVNSADGTSWVFVANGNGISGLKLVVDGSGAPSLRAIWTNGNSGSPPLVANNVLYYATSGELRALAPTTCSTPLWQGAIGGIHWESPIVANGVIYITDENGHLTAFAPPNLPTPTNTPYSSVTITPAPTTVTHPFKYFLPLVPNGGYL
jgi:PQQ-like domain